MQITIGEFTRQDVVIYCTITAVLALVVGILLGYFCAKSPQ